jgi:asparagine synthase (glutamine-hydrolysing)
MCGICGYFGKNVADLPLPIDKLRHRGPDGSDTACGPNFKFGHTRLAIIDIAGGGQPMFSSDGKVCIVYNGEVYNYRCLRAELESEYGFKSNSDTEVILHLYEKEGPAGLAKLDGMFALAIVDHDQITLARDPIGIKPLYIQKNDQYLYFASELKAFESFDNHVIEFPPGHIFNIYGGYHNYYKIPRACRNDLNWENTLAEIRRRLKKAVMKRLMSDVPLGSFLSGGLDSSLITAIMKQYREKFHTFSVTMKNSSDRYYAQLAAKSLGTIHHELIVTPRELWEALPEVIFHLESFDQSLVRSAVANYFLAKFAVREVKVVLTGEGADELFAGYDYLEQFRISGDLHQELWDITNALHNTNLQRVDRITMAHGLEARVPFLDKEVIALAMEIPPAFKRNNKDGTSKWCLREAFRHEGLLPDEIISRDKEKFAEGSGIARILEQMATEKIGDTGYINELEQRTPLRSKEEYYYFEIFCSYFGREQALRLVGRSKS